jgi:hypothetical protein
MKLRITLFFSLSLLNAQAQTNSAFKTTLSTNAVQPSNEQQLESVRAAMPQYFTIDQDENGIKTITQNVEETLEESSIANMKLKVSTSIFPPSNLPDEIYLHFMAHSDVGHFFDAGDPDFEIHFDTNSISLGKLEDKSGGEIDRSTIDLYSANFTLEQFRQIAWANKVYVKLEYKRYEIPPAARQKWKLLWKYFDLLKAQNP